MALLHASPIPDLDQRGLIPGSKPATARSRMEHIYLGNAAYLKSDFFEYCRSSRYFIYSVDVSGLDLDDSCPGGQWRTSEPIGAERVTRIGHVDVRRRRVVDHDGILAQ